MVPEKIKVDQSILKEFASTGNLDNLSKNKVVRYEYKGKFYVFVGSSSDIQIGYRMIACHIAVPRSEYKGTVAPMKNEEHIAAVNSGTRERGYYGRLVYENGKPYVLTDYVLFMSDKLF